ncbi:MAG: hypothetical protein COU07_03180 [Candidatus Harrisonbacteria bacterium CG10_big_fil_rev_8_21_14_0_10_40_38]|uniref:Glycosyltransferase family 1 protein n=1 Tax=Candidatus Harrisonbacteria bacterium CG10_big_fil_rev_8_21_14_0_10_40_38 TaxID=1974583 RepID=A0A2H0URP3_9BACT|nr:MAG: hypothetical protein COU07_03180 [Candidatus Harrisonbacteria bacterium CG10_big_fil_rev_8_21_14_0_10_40_38]
MKNTGKKIKVGIFADGLNRKGMGTAVVLQRIVDEYIKQKDEIELVLIHRALEKNEPMHPEARSLIVKEIKSPKAKGFISYGWFFLSCPEKFDIMHFPRPALHPLFIMLKLLRKTKKIVVTFHGAPDNKDIPIFETRMTKFNKWFIRRIGQHFIDAAIGDSKTGAEQVKNYYHISEKKLHAIYLGVDKEYVPLNESEKKQKQEYLENKYGIKSPYILSVSRFDPHKNVHRLIEAFDNLDGNKETLVLVGGKHEPKYSEKVMKLINESPKKDKIYIPPFIEDEDMPLLYACADAFIFPSLSEGFGLPLIEAMASGTPVVASDTSCLPEVGGSGALYADPYNSDDIKKVIQLVLENESIKNQAIKNGLIRSKEFTWEKTAKETINLYEQLLGRLLY